jgi:hypothetical protein
MIKFLLTFIKICDKLLHIGIEMEKCIKHPKYKGNKKPLHQCGKCLSIYLTLKSRPRLPMPKPSQPHRSAKDYSRKPKHKKPLV